MKVTVRIHRPTGLEFRTKKIDKDDRVTLVKRKKNQAEWRPKIRALEVKHGWFGRTKFYADVFPDATETWTYNYETKTEDTPHWDKKQSTKYLSAKILEKAGEEPKEKSNATIWILAILIIGGIIINVLLSTGRLHI